MGISTPGLLEQALIDDTGDIERHKRTLAPSHFWRITLHMLRESQPSTLSPGERYIASDDMELQIAEQIRRLKRRLEKDDQKLVDTLVLVCGHDRDAAETLIEDMHAATYYDAERQLRERYVHSYRVLYRKGSKK